MYEVARFWFYIAIASLILPVLIWAVGKLVERLRRKPSQIATPIEEMPRFATVLDCGGQMVVLHFPEGTTRTQADDAEETLRRKKTGIPCPRCGGRHKPIVVEVKKRNQNEVQN